MYVWNKYSKEINGRVQMKKVVVNIHKVLKNEDCGVKYGTLLRTNIRAIISVGLNIIHSG